MAARHKLITDEQTRRRMRRVGTKNTPPEITVRQVLHRAGLRFSLCRRDLPGCPDVVLPKWKTVVFVHGCFWHGHDVCAKGRLRPRRNSEFWESKITYNQAKDKRVADELNALGWHVIVVWECQTREVETLRKWLECEIRGHRGTEEAVNA